MNERLREIETRMAELRAQLAAGEGDLDAIEAEVRELTRERDTINRRAAMIDELNGMVTDPIAGNATGTAEGVRNQQGERSYSAADPEYRNAWQAMRENRAMTTEEQRAYDAVDIAYRDAWATVALGHPLTAAQRSTFDAVNAEYRAYTHDTNNTSVLIPNTVTAGIWRRVEESYPLWADVRKFHIRGTLTSKRHVSIDAGDADWYDEETEVADEQNTFGELTLSGCELAKSITVTWKLRAMAVADFIPFIEREVAERAGVALGMGVYSGKGKSGEGAWKAQPRGIKTYLTAEAAEQIVSYTTGSLKEADLRNAVAKLHSSYVKGAKIYCNNTTAWTVLAGIQDANKRPIFLNDVSAQGAVGRIFGMPVKVDASLADGEILIGDPYAGYWANINEDLSMHQEDHVKARKTDYMVYGIVDGDVFDEKAFALIKPGA